MSIESGATYKITNVKAGTALDLSGTDNKSIIGYTVHGGPNQQWQLEQLQSGGWSLKNIGANQYLGIEGNPQNGLSVIGVQNQTEWHIWKDEHDSSVFRLFVPNTTQNVDLSDHGNPTPGTLVTLWEKTLGKNQTWKFERV